MRDTIAAPATDKKYNKIYYIFPILYILMVYVMWFGILFNTVIPVKNMNFDSTYAFIIMAFLCLTNIIVPIIFAKRVDRTVLLNGAMIVKCGLIPFYIMGGCLILTVLMLSFIPVPMMIFLAPGLAFMLGVIGWLILAFSSPYSIAYFVMAAKQKKCQTYVAVIVSILQFIFTLDVVSLFCMSLMERKWVKLIIAIAVILFVALAAIVILIALVTGGIIFANL